MILLDENVDNGDVGRLRRRDVICQKIGMGIGRKGMDDESIIVLLHSLKQVTFITRDVDFKNKFKPHPNYCLVFVNAGMEKVVELVKKLLKDPSFNTKTKRMGKVLEVNMTEINVLNEV